MGQTIRSNLKTKYNGKEVYFLPRHGRGHFISPSNINFRANIDALKQLGAETFLQNGYLRATLPKGKFIGNEIKFPQVSVGATECAIMAATLAIGKTKIYKCCSRA